MSNVTALFKNVPQSARDRSSLEAYRVLREAYAKFLKADSQFIMALNDYVETGLCNGVILASEKQEEAFKEFSVAKAIHQQYISGANHGH